MRAYATLTTSELYARREGDNHDGEVIAAHNLTIENINLGQLYLTSEDYTIAWPGNHENFRFANDDAYSFISEQLKSEKQQGLISSNGYDTTVRLRMLTEEAKVIGQVPDLTFSAAPSIHELNFYERFEKDEYEQVEIHLSKAAEARYDFDCCFDGFAAQYAFSTENPEVGSNHREMAVRLPREHRLAKGTLAWILCDRHTSSQQFNRKVDIHHLDSLDKIYEPLMELTERIWG